LPLANPTSPTPRNSSRWLSKQQETQICDTHLTPEPPQRLGAPDVQLQVGSKLFPVHRSLIAVTCGVLHLILQECEEADISSRSGGSSLPTFVLASGSSGRSASSKVPAAVERGHNFDVFLQLLYGQLPRVSSKERALDLLQLGDLLDARCVLRAADGYLSESFKSECFIVLSKLLDSVDLAVEHKLPR
jgi:hypothetical protein